MQRSWWTSKLGPAAVLAAALLAPAPAPVIAADPPEQEKKQDEKKGEEKKAPAAPKTEKTTAKPVSPYAHATRTGTAGVKVYTNEDLERLSRGAPRLTESRPGAADPAASRGTNPLVDLEQMREAQRERAKQLQQASARVEAARARVLEMEKQILAITNPYYKRPPVSEEEREAREQDTSNVERLQRNREALEQARVELAAAERALAELRRAR